MNTFFCSKFNQLFFVLQKRSESINVGSLYETVDDLRITPVKVGTYTLHMYAHTAKNS